MKRFILVLVCLGSASCLRLGFEAGGEEPASLYDFTWTVSVLEDRQGDPQGDDQGLSLREALLIAAQSDGSDLIRFDPATYPPENPTMLQLDRALPSVRDQGTTLDGSGAGVVIDGGDADFGFLELFSDQAVVRGLTLRGFGATVLYVHGGEGITIADNLFEAATGHAIHVSDAAQVEIVDNVVERPAQDALHLEGLRDSEISSNSMVDIGASALWLERSESVVVADNTAKRTAANAFEVRDSTDIELLRNSVLLEDKAVRGMVLRAVTATRVADNFIDPGSEWMLVLIDASYNIVERNLIEGGDAGIVLEGDSDNNLLFQNVITSCAYDGVYLHSGADDNVVVHNTTHACPSGVVGELGTSQVQNNLRADDDGFVDAAAYDFTLVPDSEHIDVGEDLGLDLLPDRPELFLGAAPDLGAVESY